MQKRNGKSANETDELRRQYDFDYTKARPNRFAEEYSEGAMIVILPPDVAAAFPTPEAVNKALRLVIELSLIPAARLE